MYFDKENRALLEFFEDLKQKQILVEKPNSSLEAFLRLLSFSASDFLTPSEIREISKETSFSKFLFFIKFFIFQIDSVKRPGVSKKRGFLFGWFSITLSSPGESYQKLYIFFTMVFRNFTFNLEQR